MRILLTFFVFVILFISTYSQNYLSIKPDAVAYYLAQQGQSVYPIRIDSTFVHGDSTDYFSFHMIRPIPNSSFYTLKGDSWIGKKFTDCGNGMNLFFNYNNDTIYIKTDAILNENWRMYNFSNGDYIQANISSIQIESLIGLNDSVKTISITHKNSAGVILPDIVNSVNLKLSKSYGFFVIPDFYNFPFDNLPIENLYMSSPEMGLIGISNPQHGWKNLTYSDIQNMQAGDEIHYDFVHSNGPYPGSFSESRSIINKYLNRQESTNQDTIIFEIEICRKSIVHHYYPYDTVIALFHDTIISTYITNNHFFNHLPLEPFFDGFQWGFLNKVDTFGYMPNHVFINYNNDTLEQNYLLNYWSDIYYFQNLGNETYHLNNFNNNDEDIQSFHYYNVNGIEWGTPFICDSLLASTQKPIPTNYIHIYPNPANHYIKIDGLRSDKYQMEISDIQGRIVYSEVIEKERSSINITEIPNGMYILRMWTKEERTCSKLIIQH